MPLPTSEGLCVMVADDEAPARQRIIDLLRRDSQVAAIMEASDGLSAVEIIQNRRPDLVFLDVQMPGLDGFDVLRAIGPTKRHHASPSEPRRGPCTGRPCGARSRGHC